MQLIPCPWCGPREEVEFHYGGQAHVTYPPDPAALSDKEWAKFVFYRDNPKGPFAERWSHAAGCRRWFNAVRDTRTHELLAVYRNDEHRPARVMHDPADGGHPELATDGSWRPDADGTSEVSRTVAVNDASIDDAEVIA